MRRTGLIRDESNPLSLRSNTSPVTMLPNRGIKMTIKRSFLVLAAALAAVSLSGCIAIYEGEDSVCPHGDPNSGSWPYCGPAEPGGGQPGDDGPRY